MININIVIEVFETVDVTQKKPDRKRQYNQNKNNRNIKHNGNLKEIKEIGRI